MSQATSWRCVPGFPRYEVSDEGSVRTLYSSKRYKAAHVLRPSVLRGYLRVGLYRDGKYHLRPVHALVAEAFLGPRPARYQVNHRDGVKSNNGSSNLEYITCGDNVRHAVAHRLGYVGEKNGRAKLTAEKVTELRAAYAAGVGSPTLGRRFGISQVHALRIAKGEGWAA